MDFPLFNQTPEAVAAGRVLAEVDPEDLDCTAVVLEAAITIVTQYPEIRVAILAAAARIGMALPDDCPTHLDKVAAQYLRRAFNEQ